MQEVENIDRKVEQLLDATVSKVDEVKRYQLDGYWMTREELITEASTSLASATVRSNINSTIDLIELFDGITGKTRRDKEKLKEAKNHLAILESDGYYNAMANEMTEIFSTAPDSFLVRCVETLRYEDIENDLKQQAYLRISELTSKWLNGSYEEPTKH